MVARTGAGRDGGSLRLRLAGVVVIPLLGVAGLATVQAHSRMVRSEDTVRARSLVRSVAEVSQVRAAITGELLPDLTRAARRKPLISKVLRLDDGTLHTLPNDRAIANLQVVTDTRVGAIADNPRTETIAARIAATLRRARAGIDSGKAVTPGFNGMQSMIKLLANTQHAEADQLARIEVGSAAAQAVNELERVSNLVVNAEAETVLLVSTQLPPTIVSRQTAIGDWLDAWSQYRAGVLSEQTSGSTSLVRSLNRARAASSAVAYDAMMQRAVQDAASVTVAGLLQSYPLGVARDAQLGGALQLAVDRSSSAFAAEHRSAIIDMWTTIAVLAVLILICALLGLLFQRSLARPLGELADSAGKVSEGVLDDVTVGGPREVRTAARGLAAAVASLRNIETQASAVARGDLHSDVVRQSMPGPLGAVVQASVETIISAIHDRESAQKDLAHRATHDTLTELPNRAHAMVAIEQALYRAQRTGRAAGLMFVDLDYFKAVNDNFGHDAGDTVLRVAAHRMQAEVRGGDTVARLGGDEFVIVVEEVSDEAAFQRLAERIITTLSEPIQIGTREVHVGASVGVAVSRDGGLDASRLLAEADAATYRAKKAGRGRIGVFDEELRETLAERSALETAIADALHNDEFVLYYQPIVDMRTRKPTGVEALIRWNRPGHGLVAPMEFIPAAEQSNLINDIGRWTLREATRQLAQWDAEGANPGLTVAVNISGRHLSSSSLLTDVRTALDETGILPRRLIVEVAETSVVDDPMARASMTGLRSLGVQVAIDDFGTGYTSIGQLPRLPIDVVKIDRSFVASTDPAHRDLVRLIVAAAHAFNLTVVAVGIEDAEHVEALNKVNVECGQGFFYARPQPSEDAVALTQLSALPDIPATVPELATHTMVLARVGSASRTAGGLSERGHGHAASDEPSKVP